MGTVQAKSLENENEDSDRVDFSGIKAKVQRVHIDGIGRTKEDIIIGSVKDVFSASDFKSVIVKIHEARLNLEELGCFQNVGVFIDTCKGEGARNDGIEVTFEVKESNLLGAKMETSVGNNEGALTTSGMLRNVFGRGEKLSTDYSFGTKKTSSFNTSFQKPFHDKLDSRFNSSVYQQASEVPWFGYKEVDRGILLSLDFASADDVKQRLMLDGMWRHLGCLSRSTAFSVREQCGHSLKSSFRHELHLDKRDDAVFPSDGISFALKNEFAGLGGDVHFLKNQVELQVNLPLVKDMVIQGSLRAGHLMPLGSNRKSLSIADRFVLGGPTTIRGFEMGGVRSQWDGSSLGPEMFWASALHFYSPLPLLKRGGSIGEKFKLHAFVNSGNIGEFVFTEDFKSNLSTLIKEMRLSYGAGLAMNVGGFARIELNYCIPLFLQRGDKPSTGIQFGISTDFL